jgi:hypothetical protein
MNEDIETEAYKKVCRLTWCLKELRIAHMHVKQAGALKAAAAIARAIKSTDGARRHAERMHAKAVRS